MIENVRARLRQIVTNHSQIALTDKELHGVERLDEVLGFDSAQILAYLLAVEEEFGIVIDDDDLDIELVASIENLARYLVNHSEASK